MPLFEILTEVRLLFWLGAQLGKLQGALRWIKASIPTITIYGHKRDLQRRIGKMPFLYKEEDADVEEDYVQTKVKPLRLDTLRSYWDAKDPTADELDIFESRGAHALIRSHAAALIIGKAGMGKTTFLRN
jgi:hypothetical protein